MGVAFDPSNVPLEFITWVGCFVAFRAVQQRLCRAFPALRTVCRLAFAGTAAVAVLPALWSLGVARHTGPLVADVNHAFGIGIFVQTSLRSLLMVGWLVLTGLQHSAAVAGDVSTGGVGTEAELLGMLVALTAALRPETEPEPTRTIRQTE